MAIPFEQAVKIFAQNHTKKRFRRIARLIRGDGGPGSGNHGHAGVPGKVGGSAPTISASNSGNFGKAGKYKVYRAGDIFESPLGFVSFGLERNQSYLYKREKGQDIFEYEINLESPLHIKGDDFNDMQDSLCKKYLNKSYRSGNTLEEKRKIVKEAASCAAKDGYDSLLLEKTNALTDEKTFEVLVLNDHIGKIGRGYKETHNDGGPGSGNFNHEGRPGQVGGSASSIGGQSKAFGVKQSAETQKKMQDKLDAILSKDSSTDEKYDQVRDLIKHCDVGSTYVIGNRQFTKLKDTEDEREFSLAIWNSDFANISFSDAVHLMWYEMAEENNPPKFIDREAQRKEVSSRISSLRDAGKISGTDEMKKAEEGLITQKDPDFGKPGKYVAYRSGDIGTSGMLFFSPDKAGADQYASLHNNVTGQYSIELKNPLVVIGGSDVECVINAWETLHPSKKAGELTGNKWKTLDKQNASALNKSEYDSIIYKIGDEPHEIQIPAKRRKELDHIADYSVRSWGNVGYDLETAIMKGYFEKDPEDFTRLDGRYDSYDGQITNEEYRYSFLDGFINTDGGPGSGNFGHAGVPGRVGGSAPGGIHSVEDKYFPAKDSWRRDRNQGWNKERDAYLVDNGHTSEAVSRFNRIMNRHTQYADADDSLNEFAKENPSLIKDIASFELKAASLRREDEISLADKDIQESRDYIDQINNGEYDWMGEREYILEASQSQLELNMAKRSWLDEPITIYRKGGYDDTCLSFTTDRDGVTLYAGTDHEQRLTPDHHDTLADLEQMGIYPICGFGARYNFYAGESSEIVCINLGKAAANRRSDGDPAGWITLENGQHVPLNESGQAIGGAGGWATGKDFSNAKSEKRSGKESVPKGAGSSHSEKPDRNALSGSMKPHTNGYNTTLDDSFNKFVAKNMGNSRNPKALYQFFHDVEESGGDGFEAVKDEYYKTRLEMCTEGIEEIGRDKADEILYDKLSGGTVNAWFREYNHEVKDSLVYQLTQSPEVHNAALNVMYENYKYQCQYDNQKALPFNEFLVTPIKMFRGGTGEEYEEASPFSSYTFSRKVAESFTGSEVGQGHAYDPNGVVYEAEIRPIDTYGSVFANGESEILVPRMIAPNGKFDSEEEETKTRNRKIMTADELLVKIQIANGNAYISEKLLAFHGDSCKVKFGGK